MWPSVSFFDAFLPAGYEVTCMRISPTDLGLPCERPRLYSLARKLETTVAHEDWRSRAVENCHRDVQTTAKLYFCAPSEVQQQYVSDCALHRGIDLPDGDTQLEARDLLTASARQRLRSYKEALSKKIIDAEVAVVDISQNCYYRSGARTVKEIMPTLKGLSTHT